MKRIIKYSLVLLSITALFSSCADEFSITKRHYNKGFYIDYVNKSKEQPTVIEKNKVVVTAPIVIAKPSEVIVDSKNSNDGVNPPVAEKVNVNTNIAAKNKVNKHISVNVKNEEPIPSPTVKAAPESPQIVDHDGGHDALSILWVVIIVILILWLIGILVGGFGLGGLINLLLVIALILLILWLLRVI